MKFITFMLVSIQVLVSLISFYAFSSTIPFVPWYEPLTMGAAFAVVSLIPMQAVLLVMYFFFNSHPATVKRNLTLPIANEIFLAGSMIMAYLYEPLFYVVCALATIFNTSYFLFIIWKSLTKKRLAQTQSSKVTS